MRITSLILAAALCIMSLTACGKDTKKQPVNDTPQTEASEKGDESMKEEIIEVSALTNTYCKLTQDKELTIAYIGGSVTDGYGSSNPSSKSWSAHLGRWITENYPDVEFQNVKCSIGGTGSYLSSFRYEREIAPVNPDLLFIEFAINDYYNGVSYEQVIRSSESIVRIANRHNPGIDIIYVLTFDTGTKDSDYNQLKAHRDVAKYYGYPCIKLSDKVYSLLEKTGEDLSVYLKDNVHPNDKGYEYYAEQIIALVEGELEKAAKAELAEYKEHVLPEDTLSPTLTLNANMLYADEIDLSNSTGWEYQPDTKYSCLGMRYNGRIFAEGIGSKLTFEFEGTDIGLATGIGPNMGIVSVTVDDREPVLLNEYRMYENPWDRIVAQDLPYGKHTVTIEIIGKDEASNGYSYEIGAILIN